MTYNKPKPIRMPEYGRHIQQMVDYAISLECKDKRKLLAQHIVQTMSGLVPSHKQTLRGTQIYWDHLAIIADFNLDIDYPEGTITREVLYSSITKPNYTEHHPKYRCYGYFIEELIKEICAMPQGVKRAEATYALAMQMKRSYMTWNNATVEDLKIFKDLYEMSGGLIMLTPENCKLVINPNSIDRSNKLKAKKKQAKTNRSVSKQSNATRN